MCKIDDILKQTAYPCSSHEVDTDMVDEEETKEDTDVEIEEELETFIELSSKEWNDNIALLEGEGTDVEMVEKEETSEEEEGKDMLLEGTEENAEEMREAGSKDKELETSPLDLSIEESFPQISPHILPTIPLSPTLSSCNSTTSSPASTPPSSLHLATPLPTPSSSPQPSCSPGKCVKKKFRSRGTQVKVIFIEI